MTRFSIMKVFKRKDTAVQQKNLLAREGQRVKVIVEEGFGTRYETSMATYPERGEMGARIAAAKNADDEELFMEEDEECSAADVIQAWRRLRRTLKEPSMPE
jgi:hypothetical protein